MRTIVFVICIVCHTLYMHCELSAKNDTVIITNIDDVMSFASRFSLEFSSIAKRDIRLIHELDADNYGYVIAEIKRLLSEYKINVKYILPILKSRNILHYATAYKKMYLIYYREWLGLKLWPQSVYYIKDPKGRFLYVELKDVYTNEHVIFDQAVLKSVEVTQKMLDEYDR
jgi:hypothetical protein